MPKVFIKDRFSPSIARSSMDNAAATSCMSTQDPKGDWTAWRKTAWGSQLTTLQIASLYFLTIQHHRNWKRRGFLTLRMWLLGGKKKNQTRIIILEDKNWHNGYFTGLYHWWPLRNLCLFMVEMTSPRAKQIHHSLANLPDVFFFCQWRLVLLSR